MDDLNVLTIEDFNGGISPIKGKGVRGSFAFGYGLNIRENNTLKCNQALKKDSSTTVTDLPLAGFAASDGNKYAFGDTGKIYRKIGTGAWALVHTDADGKITGACEFKSTANTWILYATRTKLKKITLANAGGTWGGNITEVGSFQNGNTDDYHTMRVAIGVVLIADGDVLAMYDYEDAFAPGALRFPSGTRAKALLDRNDRVITGTKDNPIGGHFITWDRLQDSWLAKKSAQGNGVNAMGFLESGIVAQVGVDGALKYWNFGDTVPLMTIPGTASAYPGGVCEYETLTHFGMNGGTKNGVYSIGRKNLNDPRALNLEYVPSHGKLTGTEIGALWTEGTDLYVAWKDGSTYGIDIIDHLNKATAEYESLKLNMGKAQVEKLLRHVKIGLAERLPDGCDVALEYRATRKSDEEAAADDADGWVPAGMSDDRDSIDTEGDTKGVFNVEGQGEEVDLRLILTPSGNETPEVNAISAFFDFDNSI